MKNNSKVAFLAALFCGVISCVWGESWPDSVVRFEPSTAVKSGDTVKIVVTPPDEPESLGLTFSRASVRNKSVVRRIVEFEGMPIKLDRPDPGKNVWTATFVVPYGEKAETLSAKELTIGIARYGRDSHSEGTDYFPLPQTVTLMVGKNVSKPTALRLYDFGPKDAAVCFGAVPVTPDAVPEGWIWGRKPDRWTKGNINQLDALVHDWASAAPGKKLSFRLKLPSGKWKVAAAFGAIGAMCWENDSFLPTAVSFAVNGRTVYTHAGDVRDAFAFRDHEAHPGEDVYGTYIEPILCETELEAETVNGELSFELAAPRKDRYATIDYLAVWPADDAAAAEAYAAVKARRRAKFESTCPEVPPTDRYGVSPQAEYRDLARRAADRAPIVAALQNPYDWVLPEGELPATEPEMRVLAAKGEKLCGGVAFCSEVDRLHVVATVEGFPSEVKVTPYRLMHYRFILGTRRAHWIAPNHLLPGPRDVKKGVNYAWLIRFDVPKTAAAGSWQGKVILSSGAWRAEVPARLTVHPFELPVLSDCRIAAMSRGFEGLFEDTIRFARDELGCTTMHLFNVRLDKTKLVRDASGKIVGCASVGGVPVDEIDRRFKLYHAAGFPCKAPYCGPQAVNNSRGTYSCDGIRPHDPEWPLALKTVHDTLVAIARSNGCETVTVDLGGEIGHDARLPEPKVVADVVDYVLTAKRLCPDALFTWRCNCYDSTRTFYGLLDVVGVRGKPSWDYVDVASDFGARKPLYTYSVGGRFANGLNSWYHGSKGSFREWITWRHALEFNEFVCQGVCGTSNHIEAMPGPPEEGGYTLAQRGEAFRAGIDDYRYLRLLEDTVAEKAFNTGSRASVNAAKRFLRFVRQASANIQEYTEMNNYGGPFRQDGGNDWPYLRLDHVRAVVARAVISLREGKSFDFPIVEVSKVGNFRLALDDGPLAVANAGLVNGGFRAPKTVAGKIEVVLEGAGVKRVLPSSKEPARYLKHYWKEGYEFRVFSVDTSALEPGVYTLALLRDGKPVERTTFILMEGM